MGPIQSIADLIDLVRRRAVLILAVSVLGTLAALYVALQQKHAYLSYEVIQVQSPKVAGSLTPTTVVGSSARRLQLIEQQLMARDALLLMIDELGLYRDAPAMRPSDKVAALRRAVRINGVAAAREGYSDDGSVATLTITAEMPTPEMAQRVAHEFGRRTIELSTNSRLEQVRDTLEFFRLQERALSLEVQKLEAEITAFRVENDVSLSDGLSFTRREIASINDDILTIDRQILVLREEVSNLSAASRQSRVERRNREDTLKELNSLENQRYLLRERVRNLSEDIQTSPEVESQLATYDRRLDLLRSQLDEAAAKSNDAEIAYRLETQSQAERLTVLEEAALPDYPITKSRRSIALAGMMASVGGGFALAFLADLMWPVVRSAEQMQREVGLKPIVSIPRAPKTPPPAERSMRRRLRRRRRRKGTA